MVNEVLIQQGFYIDIKVDYRTTEWYHYGHHKKTECYFTYIIYDTINLDRVRLNDVTDELTPSQHICNEQFETYQLAEQHALKYIETL